MIGLSVPSQGAEFSLMSPKRANLEFEHGETLAEHGLEP
jgi:hypothetical protein